MKTVTVKLPEELIEYIDICSLRNGKNRSEIIREALNRYVNTVLRKRSHALR